MDTPLVILSEAELVRVLMVRAAEEAEHPAVPQSIRDEAGRGAIGARGDAPRIVNRAALLFARLPAALRGLALSTTRREPALPLVALAGFAIGLASNYLDPSGTVHVLYNPLMLLLLWNLGVFASMAVRRLLRRGATTPTRPPTAQPARPAPGERSEEPEAAASLPGGVVRWVALRLWAGLLRLRSSVAGSLADARATADAASRFLALRFGHLDDVIVRRLALVLHAGALAVMLGALAGTYLRGLVLDYRVVWRSTFLTEPDSIALALNVLLAPGLLLLEGGFVTATEVAPLLSQLGAPAAPWIHRIAVSVVALAMLPRLVLLALAARGERRAAAGVRLDASSPYYAIVLAEVARLERSRDEHASAVVQTEVERFAEAIAAYARQNFFEAQVEPILQGFRDNGGRLSALRARIADAATAFAPTLARYSTDQLADLLAALQARLGVPLQVRVDQPLALPVNVSAAAARQLGQDMGLIGGTVVAGTAATIGGGLGKSVGLAVLTVLLGTSGPIGLLLGAIVGAAVAAGVYFAGRDWIEEAVHDIPLPAFLVRRAVPTERLLAARAETEAAIRAGVTAQLRPVLDEAVRAAYAAQDAERLRAAGVA